MGTGRSYTVTGGRCSPVQEWYPHSDTECVFCYQLGEKNVGGPVSQREKNLKNVDVPSVSTVYMLPKAVLTTVTDVNSMNSAMTAGCETSLNM